MRDQEALAIRDDVCARFGVTRQEFLYGGRLVTNHCRRPAQFSVSLARYTALYELWLAGAGADEAGSILGVTERCVRRWYSDFSARQKGRAA